MTVWAIAAWRRTCATLPDPHSRPPAERRGRAGAAIRVPVAESIIYQ
jgi:hypothetical protein